MSKTPAELMKEWQSEYDAAIRTVDVLPLADLNRMIASYWMLERRHYLERRLERHYFMQIYSQDDETCGDKMRKYAAQLKTSNDATIKDWVAYIESNMCRHLSSEINLNYFFVAYRSDATTSCNYSRCYFNAIETGGDVKCICPSDTSPLTTKSLFDQKKSNPEGLVRYLNS